MNEYESPLHPKQEKEAERIAYLIAGYLRQILTEKEHDELDEWIVASDENQKLFEELTDPAVIEKGLREMGEVDTEAALERIKSRMRFEVKDESKVKDKVERRKRIVLLSYAVAACLVLAVGVFSVYQFWIRPKDKSNGQWAMGNGQLQPGSDNATLTLEDGRVIDLSKQQIGTINTSHGVMVELTDSQVVYEAGGEGMQAPAFHTLSTPVGGQYKVTLPDGTRVWLNASSSLKYPFAFTGDTREVELTGEGYFEVAKQRAADITGMELGKRFVVKLKDGANVEVLGTHFNIMAYENEQFIQTTVLEGSVSVHSISMGSSLSPGDRSTIVKHGFIEVEKGVDTREVVAWKDGMFKFRNQQIDVIMRQVARWYGAEIVYEGNKTDFHFNATIYRNEPVSKLLALLEETGRVHFVVEGKRILVRE